ncbi:MAG: Lrp/AsnC family transcriptional regulator [Rhodoferax sp.]
MPSTTTSPLDFRVLNEYQRGFPLCSEPFARMAQELGSTEEAVLATCARLHQDGRISRVGAVFAPRRIGASTLAALCVPPERLAEVAATVSRFPEVNHNYEREHRYNLWFVVTASSAERLECVLAEIEAQCKLPLLRLPLEEEYHIDLGFRLEHAGTGSPADAATHKPAHAPASTPDPIALDADGQALVNALQGGLPFIPQPYQHLARQLGWTEQQVLDQLASWLERGILKRFGVVVRHHELGYTANAMVVHDIPDALVCELGRQLGQHPGVTLCYRRPRVAPDWPYNLFCMVHGRDRHVVERQIAELRARYALQDYPHDVLFSRTRYKQQGAYYANATPPNPQPNALAA